MKIGIVTLPLHTNYGGILQAYALKTVLENMGHDAEILDRKVKMPLPKWWKAPFIYGRRALVRLAKGPGGPEVFRELRFRREFPALSANTSTFVSEYVRPRIIESYRNIHKDDYEAFVVGSDQVWRPRYFGRIEDAFLGFTDGWNVLRVAYAASFGTEQLEYEYEQLESCSALLGRFDGVSVREDTAVTMCDEWFDCDRAVHVLDPVFLLERENFEAMAGNVVERKCRGKIVSYMLDGAGRRSGVTDFVAKVTGKDVVDMSIRPEELSLPLDQRVVPPVEQWIAGFADADFVVTDSFHGCVMSILFHKPFLVVGNAQRGQARFGSLLRMFALESRLVEGIDPEDDGEGWLMDIDWESVDKIMAERREASLTFLGSHLAPLG